MTILDKVLLRRDTSKAPLPAYWPARRNTMTKVLTVFVLASMAFAADSARELKLQQAINLMESKGDLGKAVPMLEDVARSSDRALAARALLYLGQAQERQGADKARATYERIVKEFGNQTETVAAAQQRLTALGAASTTLRALRLVTNDSPSDTAYNTLSPDGQWLGGTDWMNGDLVLRHVSTGEIRRLVPVGDPSQEMWGESPVLSPDEKQVAYWWFDDRNPNEYGQLRVMPNQPGAKPRVVVGASGEFKGGAYPFGWSPDGKRILAILGIDDPQSKRIAWISATDSSVQVIKEIEAPKGFTYRLSPDGQYIAYSAPCRKDAPETCIYVLSADGATQSELVRGDMNQGPIWTPDGSRILFNSNRSGTFGLWSVPVRDGKRAGVPSLLKPETGPIGSIGMARSGRFYYNYQAGLNQIFVAEMDAATGNARGSAVSVPESFVGMTPAWSRDGKWLAFLRPRAGSNNELILHSMEAGSEWTIAPNQKKKAYLRPMWLLDGSVQPIGINTLRVSVSGGQPKEIKTPIVLPVGELSPDDKLLYVGANRDPKNTIIDVIEVATGDLKQTFEVPGGVTFLALSPDGKTLAIVGGVGTGTWHLSRIGVDGSAYREIYSGISRGQPAWTRDGRSILFVQPEGRNSAVGRMMRIPAEGGQPEFTGIRAEGLQDIDLSPDGSKIAYSSRTHDDQVWVLDNVLSVLK
jgi:Tol biopolymer transport system component